MNFHDISTYLPYIFFLAWIITLIKQLRKKRTCMLRQKEYINIVFSVLWGGPNKKKHLVWTCFFRDLSLFRFFCYTHFFFFATHFVSATHFFSATHTFFFYYTLFFATHTSITLFLFSSESEVRTKKQNHHFIFIFFYLRRIFNKMHL